MAFKMTRLGTLVLHLVYALVILLQMTSAVGFNLTAGDGEVRCKERERQALLTFKQGLIDEFDMLSSWGGEEVKMDCCQWSGVTCSNRNEHVIKLDLREMDLQGNFSSSLFELRHLSYLDLGQNRLSSHIPESISSLHKLKHLDLSENEFTGPIPHQLGNLSSLELLNLGYNKFDSVTTLEWLYPLSTLGHLDLSEVDLSKAVYWLHLVNKIPYLTELLLGSCKLQDVSAPFIPMFNTSTSLSILDLSGNNFTVSAFHWLFKFSQSLDSLYLSKNYLRGPIAEAIGTMTSLKVLDLQDNELEGGIPKSFGNLCQLTHLYLDYNDLNGMLPEFIGNLSGCMQSSLKVLSIRGNEVAGSLPDLIANFSSLGALDLSNNKLSGPITRSIGRLSSIKHLSMGSNNFSGVIAEVHFLELSKLKSLNLSFNHLSINFSRDWNPPFQLDMIDLGSCSLGPEFPEWIKTQRQFRLLHLPRCGISGSIPEWFWNLSSGVNGIDLSLNNLSGTLPDLSEKFQGSPGIDLSSNNLEGELPLFPAKAKYVDLSNNTFSGSLSSLCSITGQQLEFLDLSINNLSGVLPDCFNNWPMLIILKLANNHFSGEIPSSVGSLSWLESVSLRNNSLVGEIPRSLGNCSDLQFVDLSHNRFSRKIPNWIGERLSNLTYLLLKSNKFHGGIPLELCRLTNIQLLDFSNNSLSGSIPQCIHQITALFKEESSVQDHVTFTSADSEDFGYTGIYKDKTSLMWKGTEYEIFDLKYRRIIDFSSNGLSGSVPAQVWSLIGLVQLNLSRNQFTGRVSPDVGQMKHLQSLDLSRNRLSGQLPQSMSQLDALGKLDLSHNNFSGRVPSGAHIETFYPSALVGNPALCGPALTQPCPGDENPKSELSDKGSEEDDNGLWAGFIPGLEIGAAVGFVGVLAFRLDYPWKHVVPVMINKLKVWLGNLKECLYFITAILAFLVKETASRLRRKFKFQEP